MNLNLIKGKQFYPRRTLIYGLKNIGKSTLANQFPNPVFGDTEKGLGDINATSFQINNWTDCESFLAEIAEEKHDFKTLVIDSIDWLERIFFEAVCIDYGKSVKSIEDIGYAKGYIFALKYWDDFITKLDFIRLERKMEIVLISHEKIEKLKLPDLPDFDRYVPKIHKHACALITEWCDEVFFATRKTLTKKVGEGLRERVLAISGREGAILKTKENPAWVAKNRLNLPDEIPLDYKTYFSYITKNKNQGKK